MGQHNESIEGQAKQSVGWAERCIVKPNNSAQKDVGQNDAFYLIYKLQG
jgi:hypothetical protein